MITLTLPWPPSMNHYWKHAAIKGRAIVYVSKEGKAYRHVVGWSVKRENVTKMLGRIKLTVLAYPPDRRARDLDNILKSLLDALAAAGVYENDCQIDRLEVCRSHPVQDGSVRVEIEEIADLAAVEKLPMRKPVVVAEANPF